MISPNPSTMLLTDFATRYANERDLGEGSKRQHRYTITYFAQSLGRPPTLADLNTETVNEFLSNLCDSHLARETINSQRRGLLVLWRAANDNDLVPDLPGRRIRKIKVVRALPRAWNPDQIKHLLASAGKVEGRNPRNKVPRSLFWRAWILAGYSTGLRFGDLMGLKHDDIGPDGRIIVVQKKTGFRVTCYVDEPARNAIKALQAVRKSQYVFRGILHYRNIQEQFATLVHSAGLTGSVKTLRKTGATLCECATPGSASAFLGHRSPELAARYYIDPRWVQETKPRPPSIE